MVWWYSWSHAMRRDACAALASQIGWVPTRNIYGGHELCPPYFGIAVSVTAQASFNASGYGVVSG